MPHLVRPGVDFLSDLIASQPARRENHVIVDNLAAHKTARVQAFPAAHPAVQLHFTPTYASWLNQVELWFGKIERDLLARGIFTSIPDLARKIRRYITRDNEDPKPIRWTYSNPTHRITTDSADRQLQFSWMPRKFGSMLSAVRAPRITVSLAELRD